MAAEKYYNEEVFSIIKPDPETGRWDITRSMMLKLFSKTKRNPEPLRPGYKIIIGPHHSKFVKPNSVTTIGNFIFNKVILEDLEIFGYYNGLVNSKTFDKIHEGIEKALLADAITTDQCARFIDSVEFLCGGALSHIINPSVPVTGLTLDPRVAKRRDQLFKIHEKELKEGNTIVAAKIEKELTDLAKSIMEQNGDPALDIFKAGCGLKFENHYKTMFIMKGPVPDASSTNGVKYNIVTSNLNDGISKDDFIHMADVGVMNAYAVGVNTRDSGYYTKKYNALYSDITLLPQGSDCNTKKTIPILITDKNKKVWGNYRYFVESGEIKSLTPDNVDKYVGKVLRMRSPLCCEAKKNHYCNKCYGDLAYKLGKLNVGKTYSVIPNTMMNASLKKKHDITIHLGKIDIKEIENFLKA